MLTIIAKYSHFRTLRLQFTTKVLLFVVFLYLVIWSLQMWVKVSKGRIELRSATNVILRDWLGIFFMGCTIYIYRDKKVISWSHSLYEPPRNTKYTKGLQWVCKQKMTSSRQLMQNNVFFILQNLTRMQPSILYSLSSGLGIVQISFHHWISSNTDLSSFPIW